MGLSAAVLVLDEDLNLRLSIAQILKQAGYAVSTACSPCEALKQLSAHPFGLVFLDIGLMAGGEMALVSEIRHLYPYIPLLVLSPYLHSSAMFNDHPAQMVHFLVKPVDPVKILEVIQSIIIGENRPA